jgi:hypothetical protein
MVLLLAAWPIQAQEGEIQGAEEKPPETTPAATNEAPPEKKKATRVLVMDLSNNGVEDRVIKTLSSLLTSELSTYPGLEVLSGADVRRLIELEMERQSAGCADDSACLAEVAGALGAEKVVFGDVGKLGDLMVINLTLYDAATNKSGRRSTLQAKNEEDLPGRLKPAIADLLFGAGLISSEESTARKKGAPTQAGNSSDSRVAEKSGGPGALPWVVVGVGALLAAGGSVALVFSGLSYQAVGAAYDEIETAQQGFDQDPNAAAVERGARAQERADAAEAQWQGLGLPLAIAGGVGLPLGAVAIIGGVLWATGGDGEGTSAE